MIDYGKWAFSNRLLVYFLVGVLVIGGALSIYQMPKLEDPEVKVKLAMVVTTYPGASAHQVEMEVTDVLEKKIRTMGDIDNIESYSFNDLSIIQVELRSTIPNEGVEQCWDRLRRKVYDAQALFPAGVNTSITKEDFSAVYGMFYALTADGLSESELIKYADLLQSELVSLENVERVEIYGQQRDCIEIRLLQDKLSALGVMPAEVLATLNGQNKTSYAGYYDNGDQRVRVTVTDKFQKVEDIRRMLIQGHEKDQLRVSDIAEVEKSIEKPVRNALTFDGQRALGILLSSASTADITKVGVEVDKKIDELRKTRFPTGVEVHKVFYQPERVIDSLGTFIINLIESVAIVVFILMIFMGFKSGVIIGASLCVIVVGSFLLLGTMDGTMQRVSLAAFILAMGMLVDNAIVIVDGVLVDLQAGKSRMEAMTSIGARTAMPLLGATVIAILSFYPIFLSPDTAGIYVRDLFLILAISLMLSWILALVHVPLMCNRMIKNVKVNESGAEMYSGKIYQYQKAAVEYCIRHRKLMLLFMIVTVVLAGLGYPKMRQGFFPDMVYDQCYLEYKLPEGCNSTRVEKDLKRMQDDLRRMYPDEIKHITASIGGTPGRYNLVRTIATPSLAYGELIIDFTSPESLNSHLDEIQEYLNKEYPQAYAKIKSYNLMFKKYPIEVQFAGPDPAVLHALCDSAKAIMEGNDKVRLITTNWEPQVPLISVDYSQEDARTIGLSRSDLSLSLMTAGGGIPIGNFYDGIYPNNIYVKLIDEHGNPIEDLENMQVFSMLPSMLGLLTDENLIRLRSGRISRSDILEGLMGTTPLRQVTHSVRVAWEDPVIPRYNGVRQQRVQCSPASGLETERTRKEIAEKIDKIELPAGYTRMWMGEKQASDRSMKYLFANFPMAIILMFAILIMLFKDMKKPIIIFATIPLVFAGVVGSILMSGMTFTFFAIVGALGLIGMVIKAGIVLMDEINLQIDSGVKPFDALVLSSQSRLRPVMMASLTTILGMLPLLTDAMFGSLAVTIMGGLLFGTLITLFFVPVLYAIFFNVKSE